VDFRQFIWVISPIVTGQSHLENSRRPVLLDL
jgi:hypothetical protein